MNRSGTPLCMAALVWPSDAGMGTRRVMLRYVKRILRAATENDLSTVIDDEAQRQYECMNSKDFMEGVSAFFQKRPPALRSQVFLLAG